MRSGGTERSHTCLHSLGDAGARDGCFHPADRVVLAVSLWRDPGSGLEGHCHLAPIRRAPFSGRGLCHSSTHANYPTRSLLACTKQTLCILRSDNRADASLPRHFPMCQLLAALSRLWTWQMSTFAFPFLCLGQSISFFFFFPFFLSSLLGWGEMCLPDEVGCASGIPAAQGASQNHEFDGPELSKIKAEGSS